MSISKGEEQKTLALKNSFFIAKLPSNGKTPWKKLGKTREKFFHERFLGEDYSVNKIDYFR